MVGLLWNAERQRGFPATASPVPAYDTRQWPKYGWISVSLCEKCWRQTDLTHHTRSKIWLRARELILQVLEGKRGLMFFSCLFNRNYCPCSPRWCFLILMSYVVLHCSHFFFHSVKSWQSWAYHYMYFCLWKCCLLISSWRARHSLP